MPRRKYTPEQIISKLREAEVQLSQGQTVGQVCKSLGVSDQTYYRWRKEYGGMRTSQVHRLKELERENARLKKLVADLSLDNAILKEAVSGNPGLRPGQADQPGQETQGCRERSAIPGCLRAPGVQGSRSASIHTTLQKAISRRRGGAHRTHC